MAGTWTTTNPPTRPGAYFNFQSAAQDAPNVGVTGVTAIIGQASWGPHNAVQAVNNMAEFDLLYSTATSELRVAAHMAFDGFTSGASRLLIYRIAGTGPVKATVTVNDTASTPVAALVLTARYVGTRPNASWAVTIQTNANDSTKKDLILYEAGLEIERLTGITNTNTAFAAAINSLSQYVTAAVTGTAGRPLGNLVGVAGGTGGLASGANGAAYDGAALSVALTAYETRDFNTAAVANLTDATMRTAFAQWVTDSNQFLGKRFFGVIGGALDEIYTDARDRSDAIDAPDVINVGATQLVQTDTGTVYSTAQLAPRVAGAVAGAGLRRSLTYMILPGYQVSNPLNNSTYSDAITQGLVVFANHTSDSIRVEAGVTTLQTTNTSDRPAAYQHVRNVFISHYIQTQLTAVANTSYIGQVPNTDTARRDLVGNFLSFLKALENQNVLQSGSTVSLDDRFTQSGNAVYIAFSVAYLDSIERIFTTVQIGRS